MRGAVRGIAVLIAAVVIACLTSGGDAAQSLPVPARIAFSSGGRLFTIAADGSDRHRLTGPIRPRGEYRGDSYPAWSPDGVRLAFVRTFPAGRGDSRSQLFLANADGSATDALTGANKRVYVSAPDWSPDGQRLAFARFSPTGSGFASAIVVIRHDGTGQHVVVKKVIRPDARRLAYVSEPSWSPDGTQLAYTKTVLDAHAFFRPSLRLVNPDGSGGHLLKRDGSDADWSPDGSRIAFVSIRDRNGSECGEDECSYKGEIYAMDANGTNLVRLTQNKGSDYGPAWSADGQRLAFYSDRNFPYGASPELYSIDPAGACLTWLTNGSPSSITPAWEPDPLASSAPGACGAAGRPPLVELDARRAKRVRHFKPLWLGTSFHGMLLSQVDAGRGLASFDYSDCGRFSPMDCGPTRYLREAWVCSRHTTLRSTRHFRKRRRALVGVSRRRIGLTVNAGTAFIDLDVQGPHQGGLHQSLGVVDGLRRLGESVAAGGLPPARLPRRLIRRLRKAGALDTVGPLRRVDCPFRPPPPHGGLPPLPPPP